ncbi:MAG TPA: L,D-transpeptidase [Thermomicrobiales bacterium]|jgi:hypothetical protein|nr:L,D-transpeptidase [Thermomicrobiales bacterium]
MRIGKAFNASGKTFGKKSRMKKFVVAAAAWLVSLSCAHANIVITVDKTAQRLSVAVNGAARYQWPVSTARWGYRTPNGTYRPQRLERKWFSREFDNSPMPYSIFFHNGYAIHGSYEISHLGRPASHGCIRLHPEQAAILFKLVKANVRDTQIVITGDRPARGSPAVASDLPSAPAQPDLQEFQTQSAPQGFQSGFGAPASNPGFDNGAIPYRPPGF